MKYFHLSLLILALVFGACDSSESNRVSSPDSTITTVGSSPPFSPPRNPTPTPIPNNSGIPAELQVHLSTFIAEANRRGIALNSTRLNNLRLRFGQLSSDVLGVCSTANSQDADIVISDVLRGRNTEWTTIHELGHCILRMEHRDDVLSIMNTNEVDAELDAADRTAIFDEFFQERFFEQF